MRGGQGDGGDGPGELVDAIVALGRMLPGLVLADIAAEIEALPADGQQADMARIAGRASKLAMRARARERLLELIERWQRERPGVPMAALAWALRAAGATDDWHRRSQRLSLIWTGPRQLEPPARRTDQALLELIERAQRSITIVTFAAYRVERIHRALVEKARQGLELTFIVESPEDSQGELRSDPRQAIGSALMQRALVLVWPAEQRERDERGRPGVLHAKCAIADERWLLLSSANVTGRAMDVNMELGVLIEGGDLPRLVTAHFDALITEGVLERLV